MKKRVFALLCIVFVCFSMFLGGCSGSGNNSEDEPNYDEPIDPNRTQLYVGNYNGGLGARWLWEVKELFEKAHPDIQVKIDNDTTGYESTYLEANIATNRQDLYFLDSNPYYTFVAKGHFLDISDIVDKPLNEIDSAIEDSETILSKMDDELAVFYRNTDNKYYGLPFHNSYHHMIYDIDLFEEKNLWFKEGGGFVESENDRKSAGQDGVSGTSDDGLPVTYSDFFDLLDRMVDKNVIPFTWSGQQKDIYLPYFLTSVWADYMGTDEFHVNYSFAGETRLFKDYQFTEPAAGTFTLPTNSIETKEIGRGSVLDLVRQPGKYYALKFAKDIMSDRNYFNTLTCMSPSESHTGAQRTFVQSRVVGDKPIAMLIDGNWWISEAETTMRDMAEELEDDSWLPENRNFGVMPIPKADDDSSASGHTIAPYSSSSLCAISAYTKKEELAKQFLAFCHSDEAMRIFTEWTGATRPFDYEYDDILKSIRYPYLRNFAEFNANVDYSYAIVADAEARNVNEVDGYFLYQWAWTSEFGGFDYSNPFNQYWGNKPCTALEYFAGMKTYQDNNFPDAWPWFE